MGVLGFFGFVACLIWFVVNVFRKKSLKTPAILLIAFVFIFPIAMAVSPTANDTSTVNTLNQEVQEVAILEASDQEPVSEEKNDIADVEEPVDLDSDQVLADERAPPTGKLEVHFIDVGQGDSILIKTPEKNILIDGGDRGNTAVNYLKNQGVSSLDLVIGTHPHADHIGGLINVMQVIPVKEIIDPGVLHTTITFEDYLDIIDEKNIKYTEGRAGMERDLGGGATMQIIHPTSPSSDHLNNASIVCRITFGEISFMFTGDAEREAESQILKKGHELKSDILKVGHHGSSTSTTSSFLNAVSPSTAVILCGQGNQYGHPHEETLSKLTAAGVDIYRTDKHGTTVITTDGVTYDVNMEPYNYTAQKQETPAPEADIEGKYLGSRKSDKYHYPNCLSVNNINPENLISFGSVAEAKAAGYSPCGNCRPPQ